MKTIEILPSVLVVEGDPVQADRTQLQLRAIGYNSVEIALNGETALEMVQQKSPGLVLVDIELGAGIDGITIAQQIQQCADVPIIFFNAHGDPDALGRAKLAKPQGFILKPFSNRELSVCLEMALYKHQAEKKLLDLAQHDQAILNNMFDGVITIDTSGKIESFNHAARKMFGYVEEEVLGKNVSLLMPEPHQSQHDGYLRHYQQTGEARVIGNLRELDARRKDGTLFPITLAVTKIQRAGNTVFIGVIRDVSEQRKNENEIRRLAFYDDLTNLPNRRLLLDRLQQAKLALARNGLNGALIFLDLDHFKQINDALGHHIGDKLLSQASERLLHCVREGDTVARLGGDEFVVLLENLHHNEHDAALQAEDIANKILSALAQTFVFGDRTYQTSASIGIVLFAQSGEAIEDILKCADAAMYQAKTAGRNTVRFFDPAMQAAADAYLTLKNDLQYGIKEGQFALHYQIQVAASGDVVGVEALLRWHHPSRGLVAPAQFIPMAEDTGLILPLGQWVMEEACRQLVLWATHPICCNWSIAVNVSASQFAHPDFVQNVLHALAVTGAMPQHLKLELTESMLAHDVDNIIAKMAAIKQCGVSFSLDDFGTGYSSLSYLKQLPLDQLKIDQSFVRDILNDVNDTVIVRTILALGHSLRLQVIAEGVETVLQRNCLREMGCDVFQGYYFGRPTTAEKLADPP